MSKKTKNKRTCTALPECAEPQGRIITDPQGSYTGRPETREDMPVQDADDL